VYATVTTVLNGNSCCTDRLYCSIFGCFASHSEKRALAVFAVVPVQGTVKEGGFEIVNCVTNGGAPETVFARARPNWARS
jgi:hypothetical protein